MKTKLTPADKLEKEIRAQYIPAQIAVTLSQILDNETNALWCATPEGKAQTMKEHNYTEDAELDAVLEKQAARAAQLQLRVDFLKELYNRQSSKRP